MSSYSDFAAYYDELTQNVDYERMAAFIHQLLLDEGIDGGILLDAACGTGTLCEAFARISLFLEPGGVFVFDANTLYKHREILADNTYVYDCEDVYCVWQNTLEGDRVRIHLDLFEADGDCYYRTEEEFCELTYPAEQLCSMLEQAGLSVTGIYDGYTRKQPGEKTERLVFAARKRK